MAGHTAVTSLFHTLALLTKRKFSRVARRPEHDVAAAAEGPGADDASPLEVTRRRRPWTSKRHLSAVWLDRDLSWLEFNRRVLAEALDERTPLLERAKFLAIFTSNLDEFFMKRIAVLRERRVRRSGGSCSARFATACCRCCSSRPSTFVDRIVPELSQHGIHLRRWERVDGRAAARGRASTSTRRSRRR